MLRRLSDELAPNVPAMEPGLLGRARAVAEEFGGPLAGVAAAARLAVEIPAAEAVGDIGGSERQARPRRRRRPSSPR